MSLSAAEWVAEFASAAVQAPHLPAASSFPLGVIVFDVTAPPSGHPGNAPLANSWTGSCRLVSQQILEAPGCCPCEDLAMIE
jgi:hypothetical protein